MHKRMRKIVEEGMNEREVQTEANRSALRFLVACEST
jgi:hypothetical protein